MEMDSNIYKHVCHSVRWIVCPFCKCVAEALVVAKGVINMISALSPLSWWKRPLQKALGPHMHAGEVFEECFEWLEFSRRTTILFKSLVKELEDLFEQLEEDSHSGDCSDDCSVATITQCRRTCYLTSGSPKEDTTEYNIVVCQNSTKALLPNASSGHVEPKSMTARHKLMTVAKEASLTPLCNHQRQHAHQGGARKRWRRVLLVIRIVRVLWSLTKPKGERRSTRPAKSRVGLYTPARPLLLPAAEAKSAPIMMFSEGPQISLISQELRGKLESHVRRKLTHRVFGFPAKLKKLLGGTAGSLLKCQGTGDGERLKV
ncbi:uncharacterized protein LOC121689612 [Alosa sapidissima]|uniref:uncharacterized protein LOC121689612 n=1 Tax=Alosa sapidissima TaxID=34773 RepID=UPI001C0A453D|nr:uncharacterized protein LOC121689612 [Alosa sapidissima]